MYYSKVFLLLALTSDVFGNSIRESPQVGIIGGDAVPISDVPYMAETRRITGSHYCGASIIHERFVLTAAHCCVYLNIEDIIVAVGTDNVHSGDLYDVEKIIADERFSMDRYDYDICLLKLAKNITFGDNVTTIEIADKNFQLKDGMALNTTGWGYTNLSNSDSSDVLRLVTVPFVNQSECDDIYKDMTDIADRMFCAGETGKTGCFGDSGGPLVWNNVQVGITSFGKRCSDYPGVYTMVSAYEEWITDTIASNIIN